MSGALGLGLVRGMPDRRVCSGRADVYRVAVVVELGILIMITIGVEHMLFHGSVYPCASAVVGPSVGRITVLKW